MRASGHESLRSAACSDDRFWGWLHSARLSLISSPPTKTRAETLTLSREIQKSLTLFACWIPAATYRFGVNASCPPAGFESRSSSKWFDGRSAGMSARLSAAASRTPAHGNPGRPTILTDYAPETLTGLSPPPPWKLDYAASSPAPTRRGAARRMPWVRRSSFCCPRTFLRATQLA